MSGPSSGSEIESTKDKTLRDLISCPICGEFFTKPVFLNCGHTYCASCIEKQRKTKKIEEPEKNGFMSSTTLSTLWYGKSICPKCPKITQFVKGVNYSVQHIVNMRQAQDALKIVKICSCTRDMRSSYFVCKQCDKDKKMCEACAIRFHNGHTLEEKDNLISPPLETGEIELCQTGGSTSSNFAFDINQPSSSTAAANPNQHSSAFSFTTTSASDAQETASKVVNERVRLLNSSQPIGANKRKRTHN